MNQGLILISPVILVRLLTVEDFGRYREFLLYATILISLAAFGINSSLLRFIPDKPGSGWRFVNQAALMTMASSVLVCGSMLLLDTVFGGKIAGEYAVPVALYVLLFVNLDFWEFLWLAEKRSFAVLGYTTGRLIGRITVVVSAAALTRDVDVIIASLIGLEAVRLFISFVGWRSRARKAAGAGPASWREQLQFCLPYGASLTLVTINRTIGGMFVAKIMGPVALAHYAIGTYVQPVITVLRNSLSDVLLPEMVVQNRDAQVDRLQLWRRTTIVTMIFLVGTGVILGRFAELFVITLFSEEYRPAVLIFQIYLLVLLRESVDFAVPLRAINRTAPIMRSNLVAIVVNAVLLAVLLPSTGLPGAVAAFVISRMVEGLYLGSQTMRAYNVPLRALANWKDIFKVALAAAAAAVVLYGSFWTDILGIFGALAGAALYVLTFVALLWMMRIPEVGLLLQHVRSFPGAVLGRSQS